MICTILCDDCNQKTLKAYLKDNEGYYFDSKKGTAINDYNCDTCNAEIEKDTKCNCFTLWKKGSTRGNWELNYIKDVVEC